MNGILTVAAVAMLVTVAGCARAPTAGPNGGDLTAIRGDSAYAEVTTNAATGEVMVQTWEKDLKNRRPIEREAFMMGSGDNSMELQPYPTATDPAGTSSRFYGQAEWARAGHASRGWMEGRGVGERRDFEWRHGSDSGETPGREWEDMGEHRRTGPRQMMGPRGTPRP